MKCGEALVRLLAAYGIDTVFGFRGSTPSSSIAASKRAAFAM